MPKQKPTAVFSIRTDIRVIAAIAQEIGDEADNYNKLFKIIVNEFLLTRGTQPVQTFNEAVSILNRLDYGTPNQSGRNKRALGDALLQEQKRTEAEFDPSAAPLEDL